MARNSIIRAVITGDSSGLNRALGQGESAMGRFARNSAKLIAGFGFAAGGAAVAAKPLVDAAVDLGEELSKSEVVFGAAADQVQRFADNAAKSLGLSETAALRAAGNFGQFGIAAGLSGDELADFSTTLATAAADLASFNNLDPDEALTKLQSGLSGSAEPLRTAGIFLTEAAVAARAAEMGLGGVSGELSEGEKVLARYDLILAQMGEQGSMGDFARTSDSLANQQRILSARFSDVQAELGQRLLPAALKVAEAAVGILDGFDAVMDVFSERGFGAAVDFVVDKMQDLGGDMLDWIKRQAPKLITQLGEWGSAFISWVPGAVTRLGQRLQNWWDESFVPWLDDRAREMKIRLQDWTLAFSAWVKDVKLSDIGNWFKSSFWPVIKDGFWKAADPIKNWWMEAVWPSIVEGWNNAKDAISRWWTEDFEPWLMNQINNAGFNAGAGLFGAIADGLTSNVPSGNWLTDALGGVADFATDVAGTATGGVVGGGRSSGGNMTGTVNVNGRVLAEIVFEEDRKSGGALSGPR